MEFINIYFFSCLSPFYSFSFGGFEDDNGIVTQYIYVTDKYKDMLVFLGEDTNIFYY